MKRSESAIFDLAVQALDSFQIEIPSWGFANTGTRFGKFVQAAAASTIEEKFCDAAEVHRLTGSRPRWRCTCCGTCPTAWTTCPRCKELERQYGVHAGSINPNLFQDQEYKFGSLCNPSAEIREAGAEPHARLHRDRQAAGLTRCLPVAARRLELSRHAEHPQAHRLAGGGLARRPRLPGAGAAAADRVQAV